VAFTLNGLPLVKVLVMGSDFSEGLKSAWAIFFSAHKWMVAAVMVFPQVFYPLGTEGVEFDVAALEIDAGFSWVLSDDMGDLLAHVEERALTSEAFKERV
jgi:hypothetical protein